MKRVWKIGLCLLICTILAVSLMGCATKEYVEEEVGTATENGIVYSIIKKIDLDGNPIGHYAKVVEYTGNDINLVIPSKIQATIVDGIEIPVTVIAKLSFYDTAIKDIVVSEGITTIENFAFGYSGLIQISLPSTITSIGEYAFINCLALKEVSIKAEQRPVLGPYAFKYYDKNTKEYEIRPDLKIKVPSLVAYTTNDALDNWSEYQSKLEVQND